MRYIFLVLLLVFGRALAVAQGFHNPQHIPTSTDPVSVMAGDINGDKLSDLIYGTGAYQAAELQLLLARGHGVYTAGVAIVLPPEVSARCILGDLNGDGFADMACAGFGNDSSSMVVAVLLGNGDGTFQPPVVSHLAGLVAAPLVPVAVGDLNRDGKADLVVTSPQANAIYPLLGDGTGHLIQLAQLYSPGAALRARLVDVNEDGIPDIVADGFTGDDFELFKGHGDGTFDQAVRLVGNRAGVLADVDGDGHLDLVGGGDGVLKIFHGRGDGTFDTSPIVTVDYTNGSTAESPGAGTYVGPYACLDLNGDGIPDIVARGTDGLTVILGLPGLKFAPPVHYPAAQDLLYTGFQYQNLLADLNGDGVSDFVAAGPGGLYLIYGRADGTFVSGAVYESGSALKDATAEDFNEDGTPDVVTTGDLQLQLSLGQRDGTFRPAMAIAGDVISSLHNSGYSHFDAWIVHGDFNGDGHQDLLTYGSPNVYDYVPYLLLGKGNGTFSAPIQLPAPTGAFVGSPLVADLNGDGKDDFALLTGSGTSTITAYLSSENGTFRPVPTSLEDTAGGATQNGIIFADVNGDGIPDLLYTTLSHLGMMTGRGDGTFNAPITYALPASAPSTTAIAGPLAVGDFNGDGALDVSVLVYPQNTNAPQYVYGQDVETRVITFYRRGLLTTLDADSFAHPVAGPVSYRSYHSLYAADVTADGITDLLAADTDDAYAVNGAVIGVFPGQGTGNFGPEANFVAGNGLTRLLLTDLNGDKRLDLIAPNAEFSNSFTVLLNNGTPVASGTLTAAPDPSAAGSPFTITASVTDPSGGVLTGIVSFSVDDNFIGVVTLGGNTATITGPSTLSPGTHTLSAITSSLGDTEATVTLSGTEVIAAKKIATTTTVSLTPNPSIYGQHVTFTAHVTPATASGQMPTGTVTFTFCRGATTTATLDANSTVTLAAVSGTGIPEPVSTCSFTATYSGDISFLPSSSVQAKYIVTPAPSILVLQASPSPAYSGQTETLRATVSGLTSPTADPVTGQPVPPASIAPTGTVQFLDGSTPIGTGTLASDITTITTTGLAAGVHIITAIYSGDSNITGSTSIATLNILPSSFALKLNPATTSMSQTGQTQVGVALSGIGAYNGTLDLTIALVPTGINSSFAPTTVLLQGGATGGSLLTLRATALTSSSEPTRPGPGSVALAVLAIGSVPLWKRRKRCSLLVSILLVNALLSSTSGCSTIGYPIQLIAPGKYVLHVTANDAKTRQPQTASLNLTVTP